jgi:hypothetical protein
MRKIYACGSDVGTMFIESAREAEDGKIVYNTVRDCYRVIPYDEEFKDTLKSQSVHYVHDDDKIYVLGNDAFLQAGMAEFGAEQSGNNIDILQRPMKDGILNPDSPKMAMAIMRELLKTCIEGKIGPARKEEILYFSVPADPVDSSINNKFHTMMIQRYLTGMGYDAHPLSEALAVVYAENPKMYAPDGEIPLTGIGISMGAGQCNFCLAERGLPLDEFSIARAGDWIDSNAARMVGQSKTKVLRVKERKFDFNHIDQNDEIQLALECYYEELVNYLFSVFKKRFEGNKGSIDHPIEIVLSGGTASPAGFAEKFRNMLDKMTLPFEIKEVRTAKDMLKTVATGCFLRAKQAAKKKASTQKALDDAIGNK